MKILLALSVIFAPDSMFAMKVDGPLYVTGTYSICKQVEDRLRKEFAAQGAKIITLECQRPEDG